MAANHQDGQSETLLTTEFLLYPKDCRVVAKLTTTTIIITPQGTKGQSQKEEIINLSDVTGCHVTEGNCTTSTKWHVCIFAYPLRKKLIKGTVRHKTSRSLGIPIQSEDGRSTAELWKRAIKHLIHGRHVKPDEVKDLPEPQRRNLVVYINPFSGQGKSMHIYKSHVKKMFAESEIQHTVVETEYPGHARVLARELLLRECDGIVIVSGDGLVHEVLNGLMDRDDWAEAIKTPIGIVPGGSGNALAASIVYASTGCHPAPSLITASLFEICRAKVAPVDILAMESLDQDSNNQVKTVYGILGFVIGLIADIDIESEQIRCVGGSMRSTIYGLLRIMSKRHYNLSVSYLPSKGFNENLNANSSAAVGDAPLNKLQNNLLTSLENPVPDSWVSSEASCVQISAINLSHIANGLVLHKQSKLCDGNLYLMQMKSSISRRKIMKFWDCMEAGSGIVSDASGPSETTVTACKAFRLVPNTKHSEIMTLDGEQISYGTVQCQVHKGLGRVFMSGE